MNSDCICKIFLHLPLEEIYKNFRLCRRFYILLTGEDFWKLRLFKDYGITGSNSRVVYLHRYVETLLNKCNEIDNLRVNKPDFDRLKLFDEQYNNGLTEYLNVVKIKKTWKPLYKRIRQIILTLVPTLDYKILKFTAKKTNINDFIDKKISRGDIKPGNFIVVKLNGVYWCYFHTISKPEIIESIRNISEIPGISEFMKSWGISERELKVIIDVVPGKLEQFLKTGKA